jgi:hypothetical protein
MVTFLWVVVAGAFFVAVTLGWYWLGRRSIISSDLV